MLLSRNLSKDEVYVEFKRAADDTSCGFAMVWGEAFYIIYSSMVVVWPSG